MTSGSIVAEVKNTSNLQLLKDRLHAKTVITVSSDNTITDKITLKNPLYDAVKMDLSGTLNPNGYAVMRGRLN